MITYLIYSTGSMAILLLMYQAMLIKEKMYHFNRGYLLFSLVFSLTIPLVPVGISGDFLVQNEAGETEAAVTIQNAEPVEIYPFIESETHQPVTAAGRGFNSLMIPLVLGIYTIVALILFVRLLRIIHMIQVRADRNPSTLFEGLEVVLLRENEVPHTFLDIIFVNKKRYERGDISRDVLLHEAAHARQKHSVDILFIEFLKIIFWFNPLLYYYKRAIHLNHEFLADDAVLQSGVPATNYQKTLLHSLLNKPACTVASSFTFGLTKKRFQMMSQAVNKPKSIMKIFALIPLFFVLALILGCESTPSVAESSDEESTTNRTVDEQKPGHSLIKITINSESEIIVDGKILTLDELHSLLDEKESDSSQVISFHVSRDAEFGTIIDVQNVLRKQGSRRINYNTVNNGSEDSVNSNRNLNLPPPPPSPENFEKETVPAPPSPVDEKNLLTVLINAQGMILANDQPETISGIKSRVKTFVGNYGEDPRLSSSPRSAIVSIKTDRRTDYDIYIEILDEIMAAYNELRDEAARDRFGVSFSTLAESSDEYREVQEAYPKRISIAEPRPKN